MLVDTVPWQKGPPHTDSLTDVHTIEVELLKPKHHQKKDSQAKEKLYLSIGQHASDNCCNPTKKKKKKKRKTRDERNSSAHYLLALSLSRPLQRLVVAIYLFIIRIVCLCVCMCVHVSVSVCLIFKLPSSTSSQPRAENKTAVKK